MGWKDMCQCDAASRRRCCCKEGGRCDPIWNHLMLTAMKVFDPLYDDGALSRSKDIGATLIEELR